MKRLFTLFVSALFALTMSAAEKTITLTQAGTIGELYSYTEVFQWTMLTIKGPMNDADFTTLSNDLRNYGASVISVIDMSEVTELTKISNGGFAELKALTQVKLPAQIETIEAGAFYNDKNLVSVTFPEALQTIGAMAFYNNQSLLQIKLGSKLETIGRQAFLNCFSIVNDIIKIPASVRTIGEGAFSMLTPVTDFIVDAANENYCSADGLLYDKQKTVLLAVPAAKEGVVGVAPSVSRLGAFCAAGCRKMTGINIPDGLTEIGDAAFLYDEKLTSLSLPASLTSIGEDVFNGLDAMEAVNVAPGCPILSSDNGVLFNADKTSLLLYPAMKTAESYTLPDNTTEIGLSAFYGQKFMKSVNLPAGLKTVSDMAFAGSVALESITIPASVDSLGVSAFESCHSLKSVVIDAQINTIPASCFIDCSSLSEISLPESIKEIANAAFAYTAFSTFVLPENVERVGMLAFSYMNNLKTFYINPKLVYLGTSIMYNLVFNESNNIEDVYCLTPSVPVAGSDAFLSISDEGKTNWSIMQNATLHVLKTARSSFKDTTWEECFGDLIGDATMEDYQDALAQARQRAGVSGVSAPAMGTGAAKAAVYGLNGHRLPTVQKGFNIIRMADGQVRKVVVK